jgi:5'-deoxynucleotidase YfbR-like HD superfamily hydrolase
LEEIFIEKLYEEFKVPKGVKKHMKKVAEVCQVLADEFIKKGINIDREKVINAALIHDALRVCDFKTFSEEELKKKGEKEEDILKWRELRKKFGKRGHSKAICEILKEKGKLALIDLIEKHDFIRIDDLESWEEKILYYADKRVEGEEIVPLKERFEKGRIRNFTEEQSIEEIKEIENKVFLLEKDMKKNLGSLPKELR